MPKPIFCVMGPTASGKTALAMELVQQFPMDIVSVDSAMIYRGMDIGTAKPTTKELVLAPHHLIDILDPPESYSAAQFCGDALALCDGILQRGRIPLLVGGTMMYFNALQKGLSVLPEAQPKLRERLVEEAKQLGLSALHLKLCEIDPVAAARIHAHDAQRIQRALEVYYATGSSLTELLARNTQTSTHQFINISLFPADRAWLHGRIAERFKLMLDQGFIEEVEQLQQRWTLNENMPSMRCVGYRQVLEFLQGEYDKGSLADKGVAATRQLAKRQLTWLRHWDDVLVFDPQTSTFTAEIMAKIKEILDNSPSI